MPLSKKDIKRIRKLGYRLKDFAVKTSDGWRLKNRSGRCVFLGEEGCKIYPYRPEGCRIYPLIYDETLGAARLDDACPYNYEFKITSDDIQRLKRLLIKLSRKE